MSPVAAHRADGVQRRLLERPSRVRQLLRVRPFSPLYLWEPALIKACSGMIARGGLATVSNLGFSDWTRVFNDDARLTAALLDRLTHRCRLLQFQGESYRFRERLASLPAKPESRPRRMTSPQVVLTQEEEPTEG